MCTIGEEGRKIGGVNFLPLNLAWTRAWMHVQEERGDIKRKREKRSLPLVCEREAQERRWHQREVRLSITPLLFPSQRRWREREVMRDRENASLSLLFSFSCLKIFYFIFFVKKSLFLLILISKNYQKAQKIEKNVNFLIEINLFNKIQDKMYS